MTQGEAVWGWMAKQCDAVCRRAQRCEAGPFDAAGRCNVTKDNAVCRESDDNNAVCMQCDVTRTSAERDRWNDKMRAAAAAEESAQKSTERTEKDSMLTRHANSTCPKETALARRVSPSVYTTRVRAALLRKRAVGTKE